MLPRQPLTDLFGLLRHGQTVWNTEKRIQGSGNSPLTPEGVASCREWGHFLSTQSITWQRIIASPLQRTMETAELVNEALGLPVHHDEKVREMHWGEWEGLTLEQIKSNWPGTLEELIQDGWNFRPPEGESRKEMLQRVTASCEENRARWPNENLLVISHLGVIKSLLYHADGRSYLPEEPRIIYSNRFHILHFCDGTFSVTNRNITLPDKS